MKQVLVVTILSMLLLAACSVNTLVKTQYYLLNNPTLSTNTQLKNENSPVISITLLAFPDYLKQANLVLQLSEHQLHYSDFHFWAQPLQSSFAQALIDDANNLDTRYQYVASTATSPAPSYTAAMEVVVSISAFQPTHQAQAILSGRYWRKDKTSATHLKGNNFAVTVELKEDGYPHAVEQMRKAITLLAEQITQH
jgi:uncharacterized protein